MKKYIRTKDGIYEVIREILDGKRYEVKVPQSKWEYDEDNKCYYEDSKIDCFYKKDIIAEADTIEELCDLYIEQDKKLILHKWNGNKMVIDWSTNQVYSLKELSACNVKGAIYTDKGLIYVTKLNKNGGL